MKLRKRKVVAVQLQTAGIASIMPLMPSLTVLAAMLAAAGGNATVDVHGGGGGQVLLVCSTAREQQRTRSDCILQQHRSRAQ